VETLGASALGKHLHPRGAARVLVRGQAVGSFGPLHPRVIEGLDLGGGALVVELDLSVLEGIGRRTPRFAPIPKLPAVTRDVSLVVSEAVDAGAVLELLKSAAGDLCESVTLQAVFTGGSVPEAHRSLTFRLVYRDPNAAFNEKAARTLTDVEVDEQQTRVLVLAQEKLGATLRG